MPANLENSAVATGLEKVSFHSNPKERQRQRMLKILQLRIQQYMNQELPDVQAGFRKGRETRANWPTSVGSSQKQESSRKISTSASLTMPKP